MNDQNINLIDQVLLTFPSIDESKIKDLISYDPSKELLIELVQIFDTEMKDKIQFIKSEYKESHFLELSKWAHRIRSTSLNLGATRLSEILKRLEYMALDSDVILSEIEFLIHSLEKEYFSTSEILHSTLKTEPQ